MRQNEHVNRFRNLVISFYGITAGLILIWFGLELGIASTTARGECAGCSIISGILFFVSLIGLAIIGVTINRLRTNWDMPRRINRQELIRRTIGFILLSVGYFRLWLSEYRLGSMLLLTSIGILMMAPSDNDWIRSVVPFAKADEYKRDFRKEPVWLFFEFIKTLIFLSVLLAVLFALAFFF